MMALTDINIITDKLDFIPEYSASILKGEDYARRFLDSNIEIASTVYDNSLVDFEINLKTRFITADSDVPYLIDLADEIIDNILSKDIMFVSDTAIITNLLHITDEVDSDNVVLFEKTDFIRSFLFNLPLFSSFSFFYFFKFYSKKYNLKDDKQVVKYFFNKKIHNIFNKATSNFISLENSSKLKSYLNNDSLLFKEDKSNPDIHLKFYHFNSNKIIKNILNELAIKLNNNCSND
jgi:hypothetical protein